MKKIGNLHIFWWGLKGWAWLPDFHAFKDCCWLWIWWGPMEIALIKSDGTLGDEEPDEAA